MIPAELCFSQTLTDLHGRCLYETVRPHLGGMLSSFSMVFAISGNSGFGTGISFGDIGFNRIFTFSEQRVSPYLDALQMGVAAITVILASEI
jgi:hypothetical protein